MIQSSVDRVKVPRSGTEAVFLAFEIFVSEYNIHLYGCICIYIYLFINIYIYIMYIICMCMYYIQIY